MERRGLVGTAEQPRLFGFCGVLTMPKRVCFLGERLREYCCLVVATKMRNISKVLAVIAVVAAIAIIASVMKLGKGGGNTSLGTPTNDERTVQVPQAEGGSNSAIRHVVRTTS